MADILESTHKRLAARKDEWREIAERLDMSYEFISRLGLGTYRSSPTIGRLLLIDEYLRTHPATGKQRAA